MTREMWKKGCFLRRNTIRTNRDVDYSSSRNMILNPKLNQILEINNYLQLTGNVVSGNTRLHQASDWSCDSPLWHVTQFAFLNSFVKILKSHKIYSCSELLSFDIFSQCVQRGNEWHEEVEGRGLGTNKTSFCYFSLYMHLFYNRAREQLLQFKNLNSLRSSIPTSS